MTSNFLKDGKKVEFRCFKVAGGRDVLNILVDGDCLEAHIAPKFHNKLFIMCEFLMPDLSIWFMGGDRIRLKFHNENEFDMKVDIKPPKHWKLARVVHHIVKLYNEYNSKDVTTEIITVEEEEEIM